MSQKTLRPLGNRVIVQEEQQDETTPGGIVLPETRNKDKPTMGIVQSVGPGALDDHGKRQPIDVTKGDKVVFNRYGGNPVEVDGEKYIIVLSTDIQAIIE